LALLGVDEELIHERRQLICKLGSCLGHYSA
jgi:hypothetical protein